MLAILICLTLQIMVYLQAKFLHLSDDSVFIRDTKCLYKSITAFNSDCVSSSFKLSLICSNLFPINMTNRNHLLC